MTRLRVSAITLILACLVGSSPLAAAERTFEIKISHKEKKATITEIDGNGKSCLVDERQSGEKIWLPRRATIKLSVVDTNTAIYTFGRTDAVVASEDLAQLQSFLKAVGPYALLVGAPRAGPVAPFGGAVSCTAGSLEDQQAIAQRALIASKLVDDQHLQTFLVQVDPLLSGVAAELRLLKDIDRGVQSAVLALRATPPVSILQVAADFANEPTSLASPTTIGAEFQPKVNGRYVRYQRIGGLPATLKQLEDGFVAFAATYPDGTVGPAQIAALQKVLGYYQAIPLGCRTPAEDAHARTKVTEAMATIGQLDKILPAAYAAEAAALNILNMSNTWSSPDPVEITYEQGRKVTVTATPRKEPELASLADNGPLAFELTVQPQLPVRPALGLSLYRAKDAVFPEYSVVALTEPAGATAIRQTGLKDSSTGYALTLGLTYSFLDWRRGPKRKGSALWLPEIGLNASDAEKSFSAGFAYSWRFLKIGAGQVWTRHKVLDGGQSVDQVLDPGVALKTRDSFGDGDFYISLSLVGWQPFVAGS